MSTQCQHFVWLSIDLLLFEWKIGTPVSLDVENVHTNFVSLGPFFFELRACTL